MMLRLKLVVAFVIAGFLMGCATPTSRPEAYNTVIVVPGLGGDDDVYLQARDALREGGNQDCLQVFDWGLSWPLFLISLRSADLHHQVEAKLAQRIEQWRFAHPGSRVAIVAHSAGAGVALNALARLDDSTGIIGPVILLSPQVSPEFDLRPALKHANEIHVFYSAMDHVWSQTCPSLFGSYDNIHTPTAGAVGFASDNSSADSHRVIEHPWIKDWESLGNKGGHFDATSPEFVERIITPIIGGPPAPIVSGAGQ